MDIRQCNDLRFEIQALRPIITLEMREWFLDNNISYETEENKYGPGAFHYLLFIWFETIEDAIAFKLRWT